MNAASDPGTANLCTNCGADKQGRFCTACGQNDRNYLRSIFPVMGEVLAETFEADSRLWITLGALFARPGFLSLEFSRNRRARYLSPFRLYLFTSLLFFFVLSFAVDLPEAPVGTEVPTGRTLEQSDEIARFKAYLNDTDGGKIDDILRRGREEDDQEVELQLGDEQIETSRSGDSATLAAGLLTGLAENLSEEDYAELDDVDLRLLSQIVNGLYAMNRPWAVADRYLDYLPVAMFFLLPLYATLLKLFYFRRKRFYSEHLVFSLHIHTFAFTAFTVVALVPDGSIGEEWLDLGLFLGLLIYYFLALKRYYGDGALKTALKFGLLLWLYSMMLGVALLGTLLAVLLLF